MPTTGHFILHSNVMPPVTAGRYELLTEQVDLPFDVEPEHTHVQIAAPRYTMPTDQILSSFPPANAEGAFGDRLPQIVLKRRTLPWERNPAGLVQPSTTPWLALVVVAEGEATLSTATAVRDCVTAGTALLDPGDKDVEQGLYLAVTETVVKKIFPCQDDLPLLAHVREVDVNDTELANGDDDGWLALVLANRLPVFDDAAGKAVRYMACLVNLEGQLEALPQPLPPVASFEFALAQDWSVLASLAPGGGPDVQVLGNAQLGNVVLPAAGGLQGQRPPGAAGATFAAAGAAQAKPVVSIDGAAKMDQPSVGKQWSSATQQVAAVALDPDAKRLVRDTMAQGFRLPIEAYAIEKVLRFPVLAHWSFTTNEGATFETLMQELDVGLLGSVAEAPPNTPAAGARPEVVQTGHIGLGHRTRRGDPVQAWYRGPCVPFPTARDSTSKDEPLALAHSADQLRRVIPDGREDLALAAAFEIGRLLALSQLSVVSALLRFRGEQFGAGRVREVLAHWSFTTNEGATFEKLMQELDVGLLGSVAEAPPNTPAAGARPEVVQTGHIGLGHRTRRGDPVQAWYRGPCVPFPTARDSTSKDEPLALAHSADQLRRVIPDGREDLALAAAFEIGRLLALSQLSVVSALLRFRGEQFGAGRVREVLSQLLPFELPSLKGERVDMGRFVALEVLNVLAKNTDRMIGPRRPVADPGRPLRVSGDLDQVIATGLGFDLAALRKRADAVGVLSALEQTSVPVALKPGQAPNEKLVVTALQAALQGELQRTLGVAAPTVAGVVPGGVIRGARGRAATPPPDALDALIAGAPAHDDEEDRP